MTDTASCSECPSKFELIPPADQDYCIAKLKEPEDKDYIKRIYECESESHRNTVYWTRKDYGGYVAVSSSYRTIDD